MINELLPILMLPRVVVVVTGILHVFEHIFHHDASISGVGVPGTAAASG